MKQIVRISAVAALLATVGWSSYIHTRPEADMTNLMWENVEALAAGETPIYVSCWGLGSVECPTTHRKVYIVKETYALD